MAHQTAYSGSLRDAPCVVRATACARKVSTIKQPQDFVVPVRKLLEETFVNATVALAAPMGVVVLV